MFWLVDLFFVGFPLLWLWREHSFKQPLDKKKALELLHDLGFKRERIARIAGNTVLLFALMVLVSAGVILVADALGFNDLALVGGRVSEIIKNPWLMAYILTARAASEEVFFRGFLVPKIGVLGSSALFALAHTGYGSIAEVTAAFAIGVLGSLYFKRSKTIIPNILAHSMYNFAMFSTFL